MADREKVIKGLECRHDANYDTCKDCQYFLEFEYFCNRSQIEADALELLKAQEPRVMDAQELKEYLMINESGLLPQEKWKELEQKAPVYIEFRTPNEFLINWRTAVVLRPWAMESMFWDSYNKGRRCWTSRPTDEQREATPWPEPPKEETE